ncbi:MAG: NeuD/PglB/VioB family sugar acetyltransferase [Deltaproteobacteria bacterium]|nr:NeuD/PglB/VioB family sugar acetyltransferase [Deltaproteobacteria bacterium]
MEPLIIIGAGPQGRIIPDIVAARHDLELWGFVDVADEKRFLMADAVRFPIYGPDIFPDGLKNRFPDAFILITHDSQRRSFLISQATEAKLPLANVIHPSAIISPQCRLGRGILIAPHVIIGPGAAISDHCIINSAATVDHDSILAENVILAPGVHLAGHVKVDTGANIGIGVSCIPGVKIGANSLVGAGSVVTKEIPANAVAVGVPAKVIRNR